MVEYASVTCGHCAAWQNQVYPDFKAKYIDTNKVRYVFREFPTDPAPVAIAGFLMARCAGPDKYFPVIHEIMASQNEIFGGVPPRVVLLRIANGAGLTEEQFQTCVTDADAIKAMDGRIKAGIDAGVTGTPWFLVNGEHVQDSSLTSLSEKIDAALARRADPMTLFRNLILAVTALTLASCGGGSKAVVDGDMALGAAEGAKVTVVEYASPTCPHCALWQANTWPAFKAAYVDTNKVRYVFRELPTPPAEVAGGRLPDGSLRRTGQVFRRDPRDHGKPVGMARGNQPARQPDPHRRRRGHRPERVHRLRHQSRSHRRARGPA